MKIAFNPSTVAALTTPPNNKDITFDLRGRNIFARGVKFYGTDTNTWRDIKINNVSIGSNILDLRNGSNTTLTNTNGVVTINSTWRPVVDNLTSDSTTSSLSAKQGKVLKALIDGKSNSDHNHDDRYLKLTGGTMASNAMITFADSGSWNTNKGPQGARGGLYWTGQSDYAKLYAEETVIDNLDLVIQFGDDNSNGLSIRNKANTQTSYISSSGVITTGTFKGNLDWSYITNKPSSYTPSAHTHAWNSLTHSSTTENQAILTNGKANGWKLQTLNIARWDNAANNAHSHANKSVLDGITSALVNSWNTAYNFVSNITGTDTDKVINKWEEIVNFLAGITEDNKLNTLLNSKLSVYELADKTNVGTIKNNGIYYSTTDASSGTLTNSPFNTGFALINMTSYDGGDDLRRSRLAFNAYGEIKVSDNRDQANTAETWYNVLTSKNSGINGSTIKLNGTSITVYSSGTADGRYVKKSGDTMQGGLTIDTTNFGSLTIKRNDDAKGASIQFRGKSSVYGYIGLDNSTKDKQFLRWGSDTSRIYTILDTSSTYISNGKGVINGITITQVDNATNSTNSTNARKLVNWYSARPTSLNAQFGDGSLRIFYATSSTTEGKPAEDSHILHLAWDNTDGYDAQLAVHARSGKVSTRAQNGGTWQSWKTLAFITDIPTSLKNPYSFNVFGVVYDGSAAKTVTTSNFISQVNEGTATITDGTMLITSYASNSGFADTNAVNVPYKRKAIHLWEYIKAKTDSLYATNGHNHDDRYLKLTGGTMASNAMITFADSGSWNTNKGPQGARGGLYWTGQSDYAKLYAEETVIDNLDLVIQFGDDNSNGLSIRNKANTQTSYISSSGVITTGTFKGNLDWSYITNKPSSYTPSAHTHAWNSLTHSSTTENQAILTNGKANGWKLQTLNIARWDNAANNAHSHANKSVLDGITSALVNSWNTAYNFVSNITGTDTDKVINKWEEIVNFLAGITEDNKLNTLLNSKLSVYELADKTNVGTIKNNGIYYSTTDASSGTLTNSPFNTGFALINMTSYDGGDDLRRSRLAFNAYGEIKVSDNRDQANTAETWYNVLTSKNSGINGSTIKLNGTSITVYSSGTADGRYVKKSGDTMQGGLTIDTTNFGSLTIKRNDDAKGASIQFRGKSSVYGYIGLDNSTKDKQFLRWGSDTSRIYTILDTSSTYISNGKGVINGITITQVDNATNSTNSTNARKLVNWYSARPTSLNAQFGDGSLRIFYATSSTTEGKPAEDSHILHLAWDNTDGYDAQLAVHARSGKVSTRAQNGGTWQSWKTLAFITDIPTSLKNPYSFNVFGVVYDGSAAKTVTTSNFISQVNEGTATITDGTMLITSYASNSGFADTNAVNVPYKRKAIHLWEYIKAKTDSLYATNGHNHDGRYLRLSGQDTMQGNLQLHSYGSSYIGRGSGDKSGADFTEANIVIRSWWGISFKSYDDIVRTYIDTRTGNIGTKGVLNAAGAVIQGRVYNDGDDEGIIINFAPNGYAGLILGTHNGERSVFYLEKGNPFWRYNNGSTDLNIYHPKKSGTIALTSDIPTVTNYYWANVKISASSSTTTSPTVSNLTATSSIRMSNISLEHTDEINNITNGGIHLNHRNSGNVNLCYGGGNVGIGTTTPSYKLDVNGQMRASGFHHASVNSDNYMLLAGGGYKSFGGDDSTPIFLGCLNLYRGDDGTISSSFYCLGYSVPFTYTRGGNYCKIIIPDTSRLSFYIIAATASVNYSGGGMDTWTGYHRGSGAWWLHCYAFGWNEVRVKGFCQANNNNDSWWGGNPLWNNEYGANIITVCIFGHVRYK